MGHQVRLHATVSKVHQMEPRRTRRKREVRDADKVPEADAVLMSLQRIESTPQQTGSDLVVGTVGLSESEPGSRGARSEADQRKIDKGTA